MKRLLFLLALLLAVPVAADVPAFLAAGTCSATNDAGSVAPTFPDNVEAGSVALLHVMCRTATCVMSNTVTGWTLVLDNENSPANIFQTSLFYKVTDGSEDLDTVTVTGSGTNLKMGRIYVFTGVDTSDPIEDLDLQFQDTASTTIADNAVTTAGSDRLAVNLLIWSNDWPSSNFTGETGGDWTLTDECLSSLGSDGVLTIQTAPMASSDTIDGGTYTVANTVAQINVGFALKSGGGARHHTVISQLRAPDVRLVANPLPGEWSTRSCGTSRDVIVHMQMLKPAERALTRAARKWHAWLAEQSEPHCFTIVISPVDGADGKAIVAPLLLVFRKTPAPRLKKPWQTFNRIPKKGKVA